MVKRLLPLLGLGLCLVGCADETEKNAVKTKALTPDQQIQKLQNSNMPEEAKARAIAALQGGK